MNSRESMGPSTGPAAWQEGRRSAVRRRRRRITVTLAGVVAVLVGAGSFALASRGSAEAGPPAAAHHHVVHAPAPTTTTTAPPDPYRTTVGYARNPSVAVYPSPGAPSPSTSLSNPNSVGAPLVFLVLNRQAGWDQVQLPMRPNESTGWVQESDLNLYSNNVSVVVHLGAHTLDVYKEGQVIDHQPIIAGSPSSPTPTGNFYVTELLKAPDPSGPYGPYAFGLSAFSNVYTEFDGGPGQVAIHGTDQPTMIGESISHGCVRLQNDAIVHLTSEVPVGSPVQIDA